MKKKFFVFIFLWIQFNFLNGLAQNLNAFILIFHNAGCDNQSGQLAVVASGGAGNYSYLWSNGSTLDTAYNLPAGIHSVTVYSGGDSVVASVNLPVFGIDTVQVMHACNGGNGLIFLDNITAQYPLTFHWYQNGTLLLDSTAQISNMPAGNYSYAMLDAEGCIDSGSVAIMASTPLLAVTLSDSSLCYGASAQAWYTPGFSLIDNWGITYNSTTDTLTYQNSMGGGGLPTIGIDSLGCLSNDLAPLPFVYLQPHPNPLTVYQFGDTLSLSFAIDTNASANLVYSWYLNSVLVSVGPYSYLPIDTSGFYGVSVMNIYGCSNYGSIQAVLTDVLESEVEKQILIFSNPSLNNCPWQVCMDFRDGLINYSLFDVSGRLLLSSFVSEASAFIQTPAESGIYFLLINDRVFKLLKE